MYRQIFLIILLALALTGYGGDALAEYQRDLSVNQIYESKPELSSLVESQSEKQLKAILNKTDQKEARLLEAVLDPKELESDSGPFECP